MLMTDLDGSIAYVWLKMIELKNSISESVLEHYGTLPLMIKEPLIIGLFDESINIVINNHEDIEIANPSLAFSPDKPQFTHLRIHHMKGDIKQIFKYKELGRL